MGQMAHHGHDAIMGHGVDHGRPGPQFEDELLQHLIELGEGRAGGAQEVGGALEEVGARVAHTRALGAAHGMAADEHGASDRGQSRR